MSPSARSTATRRLLAAASGVFWLALAGWIAYQYFFKSQVAHPIVTELTLQDGAARLKFDNGAEFEVPLRQPAYNRRNLALFYVGKKTYVAPPTGGIMGRLSHSGCWTIAPERQPNMPRVDRYTFDALVAAGFTNTDLSYSFDVPRDFLNPNPEPPTFDNSISYGAPGLCAKRLH